MNKKQIGMPIKVLKYMSVEMIGEKIADYTILSVIGEGNTAITYKVEDEYGAIWALKLVTLESYGERAPISEVSRFSRINDKRYLAPPT